LAMNYKKHMAIFMVIAVVGFLLLLLTPTYGAAIFLPAVGAYFGARKAQSDGPSQPSYVLWGIFFVFVAIAVAIRFLVPEENFGGFEAGPENLVLLWVYLGSLSMAFPLFGYLAYLQRVGRTAS
jgi:hypothetical protein